jgi:hypothetical protein
MHQRLWGCGRARSGQADARIIDALLVVRGRVSAVLSFGLGSGGAGKDPYNCMILSGVGDGVERKESSHGERVNVYTRAWFERP